MTTAPYRVRRWTPRARTTVWLFGIVCIALAFAPWVAGAAFFDRAVALFVYIILAVTWNALAGYAGQVSVGQQGFFGLGAYMAIRLSDAGLPPFPALVVSALIVGALALPVSFVMLRLKEGEFAIGMWVLATLFHLLTNLDPLIQGETGVSLIALNDVPTQTRMMVIYLMALVSAISIISVMFLLLRSRIGAALQAIRDNETAAHSIGVNVFRTKQVIFVFAAFGAALAGALWLAGNVSFQPKAYFSVQWMAYTIFMVIVGGIGTFEGAILGAVIFFLLETFLGGYGVWYLLVLGASAIVMALGFPKGIWGYLRDRHGLSLLMVGSYLEIADRPEEMLRNKGKTA
jgi:branched-chain amino acid transport system permease protein